MTASAVFNAWVQLPYTQRWKVYMSENSRFEEPETNNHPHNQASNTNIDHLLTLNEPSEFRKELLGLKPVENTPPSCKPTHPSVIANPPSDRKMLLVISVTPSEDQETPIWLHVARFFSQAFGFGVFVYGTSVFAAVTLLALPMAQMIIGVILGSGLFSRAITTGLLSAVSRHYPITHVLVDSEKTADAVLNHVLKRGWEAEEDEGETPASPTGHRNFQCESGEKDPVRVHLPAGKAPLICEVHGKVLLGRHCVGSRGRLVRELLGIYAWEYKGWFRSDDATPPAGKNGANEPV